MIPISWLISSRPATEDPFLVLRTAEGDLDRLESFADAPVEFVTYEPQLSRLEEDFTSPLEERLELTGISPPPLQDDQRAAPASASQPGETKTKPKPNPQDAADEADQKEIQNRLDREGAKSGAIQISLIWNNGNDLDLYVQTPVEDIIAFNYKRSRCGGELDVDMNAKKVQSLKPVENVYWSEEKAPRGVFVVGVHEYQNHGYRDPTPFLVSVKVDGETHHFRGSIRNGKAVNPICQFKRTATRVEFLDPPETFAGNKTGKPVFK